jgi:hypothetical protein
MTAPSPRRRRLIFGAIAMLMSVTVAMAMLLAVDLYLHHRAERSAGLNRWGYRGPVVGRKQPNETRIVMLGGSTVFGYGVLWSEAPPALLEEELRRLRPGQAISAVNLGYNNEGAFAALPNLEDYRFLDFDVVILYEGYNDQRGDANINETVYRRQSPVFRLTGYSPILPLYLNEKAMQLSGESGYANPAGEAKAVFRPGLAARTSATAMRTARGIGLAFGSQLDRITANAAIPKTLGDQCAPPWSHFCASMFRAVEYARQLGARVLVVQPPVDALGHASADQQQQKAHLASAFERRYAAANDVRLLDLSDAIDLRDKDLSFDAMHLGVDGNRKLAQLMAPAVQQLAWPVTP